jgi:hypothetical protein
MHKGKMETCPSCNGLGKLKFSGDDWILTSKLIEEMEEAEVEIEQLAINIPAGLMVNN